MTICKNARILYLLHSGFTGLRDNCARLLHAANECMFALYGISLSNYTIKPIKPERVLSAVTP